MLCKRIFQPLRNSVIRYSQTIDPRQNESLDKDQVILVSPKDEYKGKCSKRDAHTWAKIETGGMLHRAFSVFLFNNNKELLLQKRAATKVTFPGVWTNTCCSHPLHVEDEMALEPEAIGVRKAAERRLVQELRIPVEQVSADKMHYVSRMLYKARDPVNSDWGEHELDYILFLRADVVPFPDLNEVEATQYVSKLGLKLLLKKSETDPKLIKFSPWFLLLAKSRLFDWWDNLDDISKITDKRNILVVE